MVHPTRWCSQCKVDWPQHTAFNLCPKCRRNTVAETSDTRPDETAARVLAAKYAKFYAYCENPLPELESALARTPNIPDPSPTPPRGRLAPQHWTDDATPDGA